MPNIELNFRFSSPTAEAFFLCGKRNIAWSSGFGSGKTYTACQKAVVLLTKFPGYRVAIARRSGVDLRKTTMQTFYKVCPPELYAPEFGGKRVEAPVPYTQLINGSRVLWIHLDEMDETSVRSLEINAAIVDQAEEIPESSYIELDNRIGRWDEVEIPSDLLAANPKWPRNEFTGKPMAPAYHMLLFNPPDEGEFSWLYQRYHPDSTTWQTEYRNTHAYFQSSSRDNKALPKENLSTLLTRDAEWISRFVDGNFGRGAGAIHTVSKLSYLEVDQSWINANLLKRCALTRVLDHGATSPTAVTWWAVKDGNYYCYREYYKPDAVISQHRKNIAELSGDEYYVNNIADPAIFKKSSEKNGGFWTVANEYSDLEVDGPPINWTPGDNNELATRNRINELLYVYPDRVHPITGELGSPKIFFCKKFAGNPNGADHIIKEINSQKKELLAEINGKKVYSDEREKKIADHAYDTLRYFCASHLTQRGEPKQKPRPGTFLHAVNRIKALNRLKEVVG